LLTKIKYTKYYLLTKPNVELLLGLCPICAMDKIKPSRKAPHEPILSKTYNDRGQIDMIDMQSCCDGPFKWILHYQDHLTKFSHLRPLRKKSKWHACWLHYNLFCNFHNVFCNYNVFCKGSNAVAWELFQIFMTQGCPLILQHDNGREFVNQVSYRHSIIIPLFITVTNYLLGCCKIKTSLAWLRYCAW
jgi:hypothetical protein